MVLSGLQAFITLAMAVAEIIVNLSRDEEAWRRCSQKDGSRMNYNSIKAAETSWKAVALFVFSPLAHWLFGLSITFYGTIGLAFLPVQII